MCFLCQRQTMCPFFYDDRPEYSWKIARWTLNTNQSINLRRCVVYFNVRYYSVILEQCAVYVNVKWCVRLTAMCCLSTSNYMSTTMCFLFTSSKLELKYSDTSCPSNKTRLIQTTKITFCINALSISASDVICQPPRHNRDIVESCAKPPNSSLMQ